MSRRRYVTRVQFHEHCEIHHVTLVMYYPIDQLVTDRRGRRREVRMCGPSKGVQWHRTGISVDIKFGQHEIDVLGERFRLVGMAKHKRTRDGKTILESRYEWI